MSDVCARKQKKLYLALTSKFLSKNPVDKRDNNILLLVQKEKFTSLFSVAVGSQLSLPEFNTNSELTFSKSCSYQSPFSPHAAT